MNTKIKILTATCSILLASGYVAYYANGWDISKVIFPRRVAAEHSNGMKGIDPILVIYGCSNHDYLPGVAPSAANVQPSGWDVNAVIFPKPAVADHSGKLSVIDPRVVIYGRENNDYLPYVAPIPLNIKPLAAVQFAPGYEPTSAMQQ